MRRLTFLDNDSKFGRLCTLLGTIIVANLMFIVTLIPVITAGAGFCALYYTMLRLVRYKEINPFSDFFHAFVSNFKQATLAWAAILAVAAFLAVEVRICSFLTGPLQYCVIAVYGAILALALIAMYLFPVMASFAGSLKTQLCNSVCFIGKNIGFAFAIALVNVIPMLATYMNLQLLPLAALRAVAGCRARRGFAFFALVNSITFMRLFDPYLEPLEPEIDEADQRRILEEMRRLES